MLEYINTGTTNDKATEILDYEVKEARLKEEWREEYMLTVVHDKDVSREGYDARQPEIDALTAKVQDKDAELEKLRLILEANGIKIEK